MGGRRRREMSQALTNNPATGQPVFGVILAIINSSFMGVFGQSRAVVTHSFHSCPNSGSQLNSYSNFFLLLIFLLIHMTTHTHITTYSHIPTHTHISTHTHSFIDQRISKYAGNKSKSRSKVITKSKVGSLKR